MAAAERLRLPLYPSAVGIRPHGGPLPLTDTLASEVFALQYTRLSNIHDAEDAAITFPEIKDNLTDALAKKVHFAFCVYSLHNDLRHECDSPAEEESPSSTFAPPFCRYHALSVGQLIVAPSAEYASRNQEPVAVALPLMKALDDARGDTGLYAFSVRRDAVGMNTVVFPKGATVVEACSIAKPVGRGFEQYREAGAFPPYMFHFANVRGDDAASGLLVDGTNLRGLAFAASFSLDTADKVNARLVFPTDKVRLPRLEATKDIRHGEEILVAPPPAAEHGGAWLGTTLRVRGHPLDDVKAGLYQTPPGLVNLLNRARRGDPVSLGNDLRSNAWQHTAHPNLARNVPPAKAGDVHRALERSVFAYLHRGQNEEAEEEDDMGDGRYDIRSGPHDRLC